nr:hypothetical protein [Nitrosopumilaceae archaeon]NIU87911.1 hypothetical protein [Nitrosopumilaceae archaeon]NIV66198.1 hypothetical protein [Nitrosopumilaceae archaeon]NIX62086.1 hypothetical protein [Nitrosopumilaceae archaeon]
MRFNDYLVEKKLNKKERQKVEDFEHYAEKIEKECSQILSVYKKTGKVLYRGIPHSDHQRKDFLEMESRKGVRKPKHIDIEVHRYLNKLFKEKFGWKVRDGLAVTPVFHETLRYGDTYIF